MVPLLSLHVVYFAKHAIIIFHLMHSSCPISCTQASPPRCANPNARERKSTKAIPLAISLPPIALCDKGG